MFTKTQKYFVGLIILGGGVLLLAELFPNVRQIDKDVQKEIEANIPACQQRDEFAKSIKEIESGVYVASDLEEYSKLHEACFKEFNEQYRSSK